MLLIDNWRKNKAYGIEIKSYFYILWIFFVILFQEVCLDLDLFDDMHTSSPIILLTTLLKMCDIHSSVIKILPACTKVKCNA